MNNLFFHGVRFLVTGGAGFIGSHLCEALLKLGCRVRCLDNLSTGKQENVDIFLDNPSYTFLNGDIQNLDTCLSACKDVDYILHEAAWGSVPKSIMNPLEYCANNIMGTANMLDAARQQGVKRFVYASSSSVYGDAKEMPKKEGIEGSPLSPYAVTKMADEMWAKQYAEHYGMCVIGLRYFNVFGPRQESNSIYAAVIPRWISRLLRGESPEIYGDGTQSRDFTYVENVVDANLKACLAPESAGGEVFNIAYGQQISLLNLYSSIEEALGISIPPRFCPPRAGDIPHSHADIEKARRILGYSPEWDFRRGLRASIGWYKENL